MSIKGTQIFGWEHEPAQERQTTFGASTSFGSTITGRLLGSTGAESPFRRALAPKDWSARREAPRPIDSALSPLAQRWLAQIPANAQPTGLCERYPRIANRIALCWPDRVLTAQVFATLFSHNRDGRRGFPKEIVDELVALKRHSATRTA